MTTVDSSLNDRHLSEYGLLKYLRGGPTSAHLQQCLQCQARLVTMRREQARFPTTQMTNALMAHLESPKPRPKRWGRYLLVGVPLATAAAILLAISFPGETLDSGNLVNTNTEQRVTLKGANVTWVVKRGNKQVAAPPSFTFRAGDRIGFRVVSSKPSWAYLFSVNAQGQVRTLLPPENKAAPMIPAKKATTLPSSLLLESPLDPERLFVVLRPTPHSPKELEDAIRSHYQQLQQAGQGLDQMHQVPVQGYVETRLISPAK